jgi:hypothetical protein
MGPDSPEAARARWEERIEARLREFELSQRAILQDQERRAKEREAMLVSVSEMKTKVAFWGSACGLGSALVVGLILKFVG